MQLKTFIKTLTLIHAALCLGLILFGLFAYLRNGDFMAQMDGQNIFIYLVPTVGIIGYFASKLIFKKQTGAIVKEQELTTKLAKFQSATIIEYALLEAPAILALLAYYFSGNALHLVIAVALTAYLIARRPTADKLKKEIPLTFAEQKQFIDI